jgi:hypothetical protein
MTRPAPPAAAPTVIADARDPHADRAADLGFAMAEAILRDASLLDEIPNGCTLFLLPEGEADFLERSIDFGIAAIRQGRNVYFKHVPAESGKKEVDGDEPTPLLPPATWPTAP